MLKNDIPAGTTWRDLTVPWPAQQPAQTPMKPLRRPTMRRRRPPAQWWAALTTGTSGTVRLQVIQPQATRRRAMGREELAKRRRRREAMAKRRYVLRNRIKRVVREWGPGLVLVAIVLAVVVTVVMGLAVEFRWLAHQVAMLTRGGVTAGR